jgi:hypothetical protein
MKMITTILILIIFIVGCEHDLEKEIPGRVYISKDLEQCKVIKFACIKGKEPFHDMNGCGCQDMEGYQDETNMTKNLCTEKDKKAEVCTADFNPVCGWFSDEIKCTKYPCAQNYPNSCTACTDEKVSYWTEGECPN